MVYSNQTKAVEQKKRWRKENPEKARQSVRKWENKRRRLWGSPIRKTVLSFHHYGTPFEQYAINMLLPRLGFTEIYDCCRLNKHFPFDFIATRQGERVLIDVTAKSNAYLKRKRQLANALRMRLFIILISPKLDGRYYMLEALRDWAHVPISIIKAVSGFPNEH